jgi:sulfur relay protein TusB/DsrH
MFLTRIATRTATRREERMKLGVFVSDYKSTVDTLDRLASDTVGIILVENGVYHAVVSENGKGSPLLDKVPRVFALRDDLETRGYAADAVDARVKVVGYGDIVDLIFNQYPKLAWL